MNKLGFFALLLLFSTACSAELGNENTEQIETADEIPIGDNSRTSLDWPGTYNGVLPCADCEGIEMSIRLNKDGSYQMASKYLGKSDQQFNSIGTFEWDNAGGKISLNIEGEEPKFNQFQVGENALFKLDADGKRIGGFDSKYTLVKREREY